MNDAKREKLQVKLQEMSKYENSLRNSGYNVIAGVDEVGRGCLAGPVAVASVILPKEFEILGIDDSKKLSPKRREELYSKIVEVAIAYDITYVDNIIIDEINILNATKKAMYQSIQKLKEQLMNKEGYNIDYILLDAVRLEELQIPSDSIVKGDSQSVSIAAASILAKVTRDTYMVKLNDQYPGYAFDRNKGYGTKDHYEGIKNYGITPVHRKSFLKGYE